MLKLLRWAKHGAVLSQGTKKRDLILALVESEAEEKALRVERMLAGSRQEDHPPLIPAPRQNQGIPEQDG